jgi:hypothetical protein
MSEELERLPLTDEQVENWRKTMVTVIGPYAAIMPREDVEKMAAMMQADMDALADDFDRLNEDE